MCAAEPWRLWSGGWSAAVWRSGWRLGRRVRGVWRAHLELAEFDSRYVAALGTVAAAVFGGELVAEAAIAGVAAVLALLVAVSRQASS